jgi:hypothetical protein
MNDRAPRNDEIRMTKLETMSKPEVRNLHAPLLSLVIPSGFVIRISSFSPMIDLLKTLRAE